MKTVVYLLTGIALSVGCAAQNAAPAANPATVSSAPPSAVPAALPVPAPPKDPNARWHLSNKDMPGNWRPDVGHSSGLGTLINDTLQATLTADLDTEPGTRKERLAKLGMKYVTEAYYILGEPTGLNGPNNCDVLPFSSHGDLLRGLLALCLLGPEQDHMVVFHGDWTAANDVAATADFMKIISGVELYQ